MVYPSDTTWEVKSLPLSGSFPNASSNVTQDFTIYPGVRVTLSPGQVRYSYTEVYVAGYHVATFGDN